MDENRLEKHMREKLSRYESLSDADAMWNAIQTKQNAVEEKPARRFPFFWLLFVAGAVMLAGGIYLNTLDSSKELDQMPLSAELDSPKTNANNIDIKQNIQTPNISESMNSSVAENESKDNENTELGTYNSVKISPATSSDNLDRAGNSKGKSTHKKSVANNNQAKDLLTKSNENRPSGQNIENSIDANTESAGTKTKHSIIESETENETLSAASISDSGVILPDDQSAMFTIQQLTSIAIAPFNRSIREFKLEYPAIIFPVRKNNSSIKDVWNWSAGIQMAYQYTLRDLKGRDGISSAHLTERIDSENSLDAYRIDVNAQLNYKNTFLETGISFSQLTDRLYTSSVEEKTIFIDTITQVLIYKDSSMSSVQGMLEGVERIKTEHQRYNRYNTIDIPIIFGYEHNTGLDKWRYYLSGGVLLNIQFKKSGSMLSPDDGNLVSLSSLDAEDYWNNRLGMKFLIAGGLKYQFHPKFEFRFGPQFEFGGKSFSSRDSGISQNYTRLGIRTGIYLNF